MARGRSGHYGPYKKNHPDTCSIDGCDREFYGKGWCQMHYARWRRNGDPLVSRLNRQHDGACAVEGCPEPYVGKGLCKNHRRAARRVENPEPFIRSETRTRMAGGTVFMVSAKDFRRVFESPCMACGSCDGLEFEHLIPLERGGDHSIGNLARLCGSCNKSKGNLTWMEWRLSKKPRALTLFRGVMAS